MKAYFTRDSVCAGDDGDAPHAQTLEVADDVSLEQLVRDVVAAARLPSVSGGRATWCVSSGVPLAVVAQQWPAPRMLSSIPPKPSHLDRDAERRTVRLHVSYFAQLEPETVFEVLRRLRLRTD